MTAIGQSDLLQALGWAVFNSLWQMAILWVAYQFIISVFRITKSSNKSSLAVLLLFSGFAWFTFTLVTAFVAKESTGDTYGGIVDLNGNVELDNWLDSTLPIASILYLALLIFPVLNFIRNYRYVQVIRRYGLSRANVEWRMFVQKIAVRMNIRKPVYIWMSELVSSPVTIGYLKPVILLPVAAVNHLTTQQIEAVLLHELSHIKRYDYFINLLTRLIQTVLYFNPFVKAFIKIFETEREKSCDETVMQFQYDPHGYASALLVLEKASHVPHHSLAVAASDGKKSEFRQRIEWIMGIQKKPSFSFNKLAGVMAALLCFIALNAFIILSKPIKNGSEKDSYSFATAPYNLFADDYDKTTNGGLVAEHKHPSVITNSTTDESKAEPTEAEEMTSESEHDMTANAHADLEIPGFPFTYVYNIQNIIPHLDPLEEKQVQQAINESKKVLGETQWKEVEKNIADALTRVEKEKVKEAYEKAISKIDWNVVGDKLRVAYDKIDWPMINKQLGNALAEIKFDSLQNVYTVAMDQLSGLQKDLIRENQQGVPDTDINLKSIEAAKKELQKAIDNIKTSKPKQVVHL
ncbi:MAG: M56 family metallopeptidase [Chitinophagaceae bacterium]